MIRLTLRRISENDKQTLGLLEIYKDSIYQFTLATIELGWMNNEKSKSRIFGNKEYIVEPISTAKHPNCFLIKDTEPRTGIMIHIVNYSRQLEGCIGVGLIHVDLDKDGLKDIKYSTEAMDMLRWICKDQKSILLTINY